jgi:hypothetical protein
MLARDYSSESQILLLQYRSMACDSASRVGAAGRRRMPRGGIQADSTHQSDRKGRIAGARLHC